MKFTATELSRNPNKVFRAAYDAKGDPIIIVHGHYSEGFELKFKQIGIPNDFDASEEKALAYAEKEKGHE